MTLTIHVAETNRSYGAATSRVDAVVNAAHYWHGDRPTRPVTMMLAECEGYEGGAKWQVDCEKLISRTVYEVPPEEFSRVLDIAERRADDDIVIEEVVEASTDLDW